MPVLGAVNHDSGVIAFYFSGTVVVDEIIDAHEKVSNSLKPDMPYLEIDLFDYDSRFHEVTRADMLKLREVIVERFERRNIIRNKIAAITLSADINIAYPLWRATVASEEEIRTEHVEFTSIEDGCEWLDIDPQVATELLRSIGYSGA